MLNRKQTIIIYAPGSGGHFISFLLHKILHSQLSTYVAVSDIGDCHCNKPLQNDIDIQHYAKGDFNYKYAFTTSLARLSNPESIIRMHPGESPYLIDELSPFLPNTEFAVIELETSSDELASILMQIQKFNLSNSGWKSIREELKQYYSNNQIIQELCDTPSLNDAASGLRHYLSWMIFLRGGYPCLAFAKVKQTDPKKVHRLRFRDVFFNNAKNFVEFIELVLHREMSATERKFIRSQLDLYSSKQNHQLLTDPVAYLKMIEGCAKEFELNYRSKYLTKEK